MVTMRSSSGMKELETISPALSSRISVREKLTYFNRDATWAGLVKTLSKDCKVFNLSFLCEPQVLARLHLASRGDLRQFKRIVTEAIMLAVDSHALELNGALLVRAYSAAFGSGRSESNPFE